jgi:DNA-binding NarL/FixJ family response regulator
MDLPRYEKTVAVVNSNEDTVEMLRHALQSNGFNSVVTGHIHDFKTGATDFPQYLAMHDPRVIVYDIAIPYENNWTFLKLLLDSEHMRGRKIVLTTTNKKRLEELVGPTDAFEIVGKPYDIDRIVEAVKTAAGER